MSKKNFISFVRTSAMIMIYTSIEYENDCFEGRIVKSQKFENFGRGRLLEQKVFQIFQTIFDTKN